MVDSKKYPKTWHVPYSPGTHSDDRLLQNTDHFEGMYIIATEKGDGENTTITNKFYHARSLDSLDHPSRHYVKGLWGQIKHEIPDGWRICGENMYAKHSIFYDNLESYFWLFSVWNENNYSLSFDDTKIICETLGLYHAPVLYEGIFSNHIIRDLVNSFDLEKTEGLVIRNRESFHFDDFGSNMAKWVRPKHVQTDEHWMLKPVVPNKLRTR